MRRRLRKQSFLESASKSPVIFLINQPHFLLFRLFDMERKKKFFPSERPFGVLFLLGLAAGHLGWRIPAPSRATSLQLQAGRMCSYSRGSALYGTAQEVADEWGTFFFL